MPISHLCHVNLRAPAPLLERLRDFYCDLLGLVQGPRPALRGTGYWLYAAGKDVVHLSQRAPEAGPQAAVSSPIDHFAFACHGLADMENRLRASGIDYLRRERSDGGIQIFLTDPAGNRVELGFSANAID